MPPRPGPSQTFQVSYGAVDGLASASERVGHELHGAVSAFEPVFEEIERGVRLPGSRGMHRPPPAPPLGVLRATSDAFRRIGGDLREHKVTISGWDRSARSLFDQAIAGGSTGGFAPTGTIWTSWFEEQTEVFGEDGGGSFYQKRELLDGRDRPAWLLDLNKDADRAIDAGSLLSDLSKSVKDPHQVSGIMNLAPVVMAMRLTGRSESEIYEVVHAAHVYHANVWYKEGAEFVVGGGGQFSRQGYLALKNAESLSEFFGVARAGSSGGFLHGAYHLGEAVAPEAQLASRFPGAAPVIGRVLPALGVGVGLVLTPEQVGYLVDGDWNSRDIEAVAGLTGTGVAAYALIAGSLGPVGWAVGGTAAVVGLAAYHFGDRSEEEAAKKLKTDVHELLTGKVGGGH